MRFFRKNTHLFDFYMKCCTARVILNSAHCALTRAAFTNPRTQANMIDVHYYSTVLKRCAIRSNGHRLPFSE